MTINGSTVKEIREQCSLDDEQIHYIENVNKLLEEFEVNTNWLSAQRYTIIMIEFTFNRAVLTVIV